MDKNYIASLNDEIGADVFLYHKKISDKADLFTIGCEISQWDGNKMLEFMSSSNDKDSAYVIFNTCTVTETSQKACENLTKKLVKLYPDRKFYFSGCDVNYNLDFFKQFGTALPNAEKFNKNNYNCVKENREDNKIVSFSRKREIGLVKIEDGCHNHCTYCVICKVRPHYMIPYPKIKEQIKRILDRGLTEIMLIGTEICNYNYNGMKLVDLIKQILADFKEITSLKMAGLDPASKEMNRLIEYIKTEPKANNTLYTCTQSCCDTILKRMKRRHNADRLRELKKLADGKVNFTYQIIIGYPGETDELWQETLDLVKELEPENCDTVLFSPREGTEAYNLVDDVPWETKMRRNVELMETVKSYSDNDLVYDEWTQEDVDRFYKFWPNPATDIYIKLKENIFDQDLLPKLSEYLFKNKQLVILTNFDINKDIVDLDVNSKILTHVFGAKIVLNIQINKENLRLIHDYSWNVNSFFYRFCVYPYFKYDELDTISKKEFLDFFKQVKDYVNIDEEAKKLIKSNKLEYLDYIMKELNLEI